MLTEQSSLTYFARREFSDARSCVDWLESVPLADTANAHEMVAAQIGLLARIELSALERLRILEVLYQPAGYLQAELARRCSGRALPLSIAEYSVWNSVLDLWQAMYAGYLACFQFCVTGGTRLASHAPLVALRCVDLASAAIREHHRVYREIPSTLWAQLNDVYEAVERHGLATVGVADPLDATRPERTSAAAFGRAQLAHLSNPYTMSPRQMTIMYRWTGLWDSLIGIDSCPPLPGMTSVLAVDLNAAAPSMPARQIVATPAVRYLGLERLGHALRRTLTLLREGHDPASLGLGDDCRQPGTERLLTLLYIQWCGAGIGQLTSSRERIEDARACVGFAAALRQIESESEAFRSDTSAIRTAYGPLTEHWHILNVSAPGFIGVTRGPECDARIEHHQLVALKRRSSSAFQLGVTQWLKLEDDGDLSIGVRVWPGTPQLMSFSLTGEDEVAEAKAVLLPAALETGAPATLVLAPGVFRPGLRIELLSGTRCAARLTRLSERGADFERAVFEFVH
jgi:hypothetical protein